MANKETFLSGCTASFISCSTLQPLDVLKTRMQEKISSCNVNIKDIKNRNHYRNVMLKIYYSQGYFGFWKGISTTSNLIMFLSV